MNGVMIHGRIYSFKDIKTKKYPWDCCPKCGCTDIGGLVGRIKIKFGKSDHVCIHRAFDGYRELDYKSMKRKEN